jgi:hypothetical protein
MKQGKVDSHKMMKSSMPESFKQNGKLPSGNSNETASISGLTAYKKGGSVKRMPSSMPHKRAC